jgi:uncharacterized cupin superfamily protein
VKRVYNILDGELDYTHEREGFEWRGLWVGEKLGGERIGGSVYELPPGQRLFPYHYHYADEEWLVVLAGELSLRAPDGERTLREGDVVCFPTGPEGAHAVRNESAGPVRFLMLSAGARPEIVVYPDSDKIGTRPGPGRDDDNLNLRRSGGLDYWDGEP